MKLPLIYTDRQFTQQAAEPMSEEVRWWLLSDDLGGKDSNYDFWMSNLVEGSIRVQFITGSFPNSHPDYILWMETGNWHEWGEA